MRLFRQSRRGDWRGVFDAMALEVAALAARRATPPVISCPCSLGELIDKITILRIKAERIGEEEKLANVRRELALLEGLAREDGPTGSSIDLLADQLAAVNARLWISRMRFGRASARETSGRASSRSRDRCTAKTMSAPR